MHNGQHDERDDVLHHEYDHSEAVTVVVGGEVLPAHLHQDDVGVRDHHPVNRLVQQQRGGHCNSEEGFVKSLKVYRKYFFSDFTTYCYSTCFDAILTGNSPARRPIETAGKNRPIFQSLSPIVRAGTCCSGFEAKPAICIPACRNFFPILLNLDLSEASGSKRRRKKPISVRANHFVVRTTEFLFVTKNHRSYIENME